MIAQCIDRKLIANCGVMECKHRKKCYFCIEFDGTDTFVPDVDANVSGAVVAVVCLSFEY